MIGFTTMTFKPALLAGEIRHSELFAWAAEQGFGWVEVRDFELDFSQEQLQTIMDAATACGLRPHYAWDTTSLFPEEDQARIRRGIDNAALFGEGTCSRIVIAPELMANQTGYTAEEFQALEKHIREAVTYAMERGVTLVFENSQETLDGFEAFLEAVPEMRMTLDTANTFNDENTGEALVWPAFREFIIRRKGQIPYVHLKSSREGKTVPDLLENGDVPLAELFPLLQASAWLCVELPTEGTLASTFKRVQTGKKLVSQFLK